MQTSAYKGINYGAITPLRQPKNLLISKRFNHFQFRSKLSNGPVSLQSSNLRTCKTVTEPQTSLKNIKFFGI